MPDVASIPHGVIEPGPEHGGCEHDAEQEVGEGAYLDTPMEIRLLQSSSSTTAPVYDAEELSAIQGYKRMMLEDAASATAFRRSGMGNSRAGQVCDRDPLHTKYSTLYSEYHVIHYRYSVVVPQRF